MSDDLHYRIVSSVFRNSFEVEVSGLLQSGEWELHGVTQATQIGTSDIAYTQALVRKPEFEDFLDTNEDVRERYDRWLVYKRLSE
jgi:hypothetical protein